jgi:hypothetical protein
MPNVVKDVVHEGIGPSGQRYKWIIETAMEHVIALGGVPGLSKLSVPKMDMETLVGSVELSFRRLVRCVKYPVLLLDGDPEPDGDWGYVSKLTKSDVDWLIKMVSGDKSAVAASTAAEAL